MSKASFLLSTYLIAVYIVTFYLTAPIQAFVKQQTQSSSVEINNTHSNNTYLALSWGDIWKILRRQKTPGGGKGDICAISPRRLIDPVSQDEGTDSIWGLNPVFVWYLARGTAQRIELFQKGSNKVLWSRKIKGGETRVIYDGKPLQPGQSYEWQMYANIPFPKKSLSFEFQIMDAKERDDITVELRQLETRLKKEGANAEKIALEKANFFAVKRMWSDAISLIHSVPNPSQELNELIKQIPSASYCDSAPVTINSFYISSKSIFY